VLRRPRSSLTKDNLGPPNTFLETLKIFRPGDTQKKNNHNFRSANSESFLSYIYFLQENSRLLTDTRNIYLLFEIRKQPRKTQQKKKHGSARSSSALGTNCQLLLLLLATDSTVDGREREGEGAKGRGGGVGWPAHGHARRLDFGAFAMGAPHHLQLLLHIPTPSLSLCLSLFLSSELRHLPVLSVHLSFPGIKTKGGRGAVVILNYREKMVQGPDYSNRDVYCDLKCALN
jgi:hypothetical protein